MSILKPIGYAGAWEFKRPVPTPSGGIADSPQVSVSFNETWIPAVLSALKVLTRPEAWEGTLGDIQRVMGDAHSLLDYGTVSPGGGLVIGEIVAHGLASLPATWLACDGSTHLRVDWPDLYAALHSAYIVDADHFKTPDLRSRSPLGSGQGSGLSNRAIDASGGEETHQLTNAELASHSHNMYVLWASGGTHDVYSIAPNSNGTRFSSTEPDGSNTAHNTMHPYRVIQFAIVASL